MHAWRNPTSANETFAVCVGAKVKSIESVNNS